MAYKYKFHSEHQPRCFHFRRNMDSTMEAFCVSYLPDGTCVLSGDYETLTWSRRVWPKELDYGFPYKDTGISYFAEKVCIGTGRHKIKEWKSDRAREEITKYLRDAVKEGTYDKKKVEEFLDDLHFSYDEGDLGMGEMMDQLNEFDNYGDWWEHRFGEGYTSQFKFQYKLLQSVSLRIRKMIYGDEDGNAKD